MLNRNELSRQILSLTSKIFPDLKCQNNIAQETWDKICNDQLFPEKVETSKSSFLVPRWRGNLMDTFDIKSDLSEYSVFSVDGSQIYPDRNFSGARCFLINLGGCFIQYSENDLDRKVELFSEPQVFLPPDVIPDKDRFVFSMDLVDLKREELELKKLFTHSTRPTSQGAHLGSLQTSPRLRRAGRANGMGAREELELEKVLTSPFSVRPEGGALAEPVLSKVEGSRRANVCFVDGTIIFWNLEGKQEEVKDYFLSSYLFWLNKFYENKTLVSGYISFPKSRELVNLIKLGLCRFTSADCIPCYSKFTEFPCKAVDNLIDTHVCRFFLKPNQRTTVFYSTSKITKHYPEHLKPCFCYLHAGDEIARLEMPFWIAQNKDLLDYLCSIAIDQCKKGQGYPVVLAEAHEQAVVKGPDREFFYHLIQKIGIEQKRRFFVSKKSLKKRGIGI